jgi:hypothetical protein
MVCLSGIYYTYVQSTPVYMATSPQANGSDWGPLTDQIPRALGTAYMIHLIVVTDSEQPLLVTTTPLFHQLEQIPFLTEPSPLYIVLCTDARG